MNESKMKYEEKIDKAFDKTEKNIEKLTEKAERLNLEMKRKLKMRVSELRTKQEEALKKYKELKKSGADAWVDLKSGVDKSIDILTESIDKAKEEIK